MKIRNILFGYCYENGKIVLHHKEAEMVKEIFREYRSGKSLLELARALNARRIEYRPGVVGWNKARIMRLLEDKRYVGNDTYPALIEQDLYDAVQTLKMQKCDQKGLDRTADIFQMTVPVCCPKCNSRLRRKVDNRDKTPIRWVCKAKECKFSIAKSDKSLFEELVALLNVVIGNPETINMPLPQETEVSLEMRRLNGEITRMFEVAQVDRDKVRKKMIEYAALKYAELDSFIIKSKRLKDIFIAKVPMKKFSLDLLEKTVGEIKMYADGTLGIVLENGQEIRQGGGVCKQ